MNLNIPLCFAHVQILGKNDRRANLWNYEIMILVTITADPESDDWKKNKDIYSEGKKLFWDQQKKPTATKTKLLLKNKYQKWMLLQQLYLN